MDWKDFFRLSVIKIEATGTHPYFHTELKVPEDFSMEELLLKEFEYLDLSPEEKKHLSINHRKILLRHHYFNCAEFERIAENFIERLSHEREKMLTFSTQGGGIYLFTALLKSSHRLFEGKKLICYTSELPLKGTNFNLGQEPNLQFIFRSQRPSYFKHLPSLWQSSP